MEGQTVSLAGPADRGAWNGYVERRRDAPPRALYEWGELLRRTYPVETPAFAVHRNDGSVAGVLLAYHLRRRGRVLYSPPFGLLADDQAAGGALLEAAHDYCRDRGLVRAVITSGRQSITARCQTWAKTTVLLSLDGSADELWAGMRDKTRNVIRKAERSGLTLGRGFGHLDGFYGAYLARLSEKGLDLQPRSFFARLVEVMGERVDLFVAQRDGEVLGGMIFIYNGRTASYLYNACHRAALPLGTNNFLMWEAMKDARERGVLTIELGESTVGSGVYDFKTRGLRGKPVQVHYYDVMRAPGEAPAPVAVTVAERVLTTGRRLFPVLPEALRQRVLLGSGKFGRLI